MAQLLPRLPLILRMGYVHKGFINRVHFYLRAHRPQGFHHSVAHVAVKGIVRREHRNAMLLDK